MSATGKALAGFTLIELLVALAILAIAVSLAPMSFDRMAPRRQLEAQAEQLASELRDLRSLALVTGSLRQARTQGGALWLGDSKKDLPEGLAIQAPSAPVVFFPDGSSSGGELVLSGPAGERRITVTMATGSVRVAGT